MSRTPRGSMNEINVKDLEDPKTMIRTPQRMHIQSQQWIDDMYENYLDKFSLQPKGRLMSRHDYYMELLDKLPKSRRKSIYIGDDPIMDSYGKSIGDDYYEADVGAVERRIRLSSQERDMAFAANVANENCKGPGCATRVARTVRGLFGFGGSKHTRRHKMRRSRRKTRHSRR